MKITVKTKGGLTLKGSLPYEGAEWVFTKHDCPNPDCDNRGGQELHGGVRTYKPGMSVRGVNPETGHDKITSAAECNICGQHVGTIEVVFSTIFGLEEDARVLSGRYGRVY